MILRLGRGLLDRLGLWLPFDQREADGPPILRRRLADLDRPAYHVLDLHSVDRRVLARERPACSLFRLGPQQRIDVAEELVLVLLGEEHDLDRELRRGVALVLDAGCLATLRL